VTKKKVLLTGSAGFIATHLSRELRDRGFQVRTYDIVHGQDLRDLVRVIGAVRGVDTVFHLAAIADLNRSRVDPIETMEINVEGTWNVAYACWKAGAKLFYASTCCTYGNQEHHPVDENALPRPAEIYACSKLAGEYVIQGFHHTYGLPYNIMRFATIYGEGTRPALGTHIFFGQALRREPITVHGDGQQTRTLTHVDDLVAGIMALYDSEKMNEVWNLTTEEEVSALVMARDIRSLVGSLSEIVFVPQRVGQTFRESISAGKMRREVGWEAKIKWKEGLERMKWWYLMDGQTEVMYQMPE